MISRRSVATMIIFGVALMLTEPAWADPRMDACTTLANVRNALYSMLNSDDKSTRDALKASVQAASSTLDSVLASMTATDAAVVADFKVVWDQFKATRDNEIIPDLDKGDFSDAKKIADGIQLDRLSRMWGIMSCK